MKYNKAMGLGENGVLVQGIASLERGSNIGIVNVDLRWRKKDDKETCKRDIRRKKKQENVA